jgi:hypothetical protein
VIVRLWEFDSPRPHKNKHLAAHAASRFGAELLRNFRKEVSINSVRWEQMVRDRIAAGPVPGIQWKPAARWWSPAARATPTEIDIVAEATDDPNRAQFRRLGRISFRCSEPKGP